MFAAENLDIQLMLDSPSRLNSKLSWTENTQNKQKPQKITGKRERQAGGKQP